MTFATQKDFKDAPIGQPFMECCGTCGLSTGVILIKKTGRPSKNADTWVPSNLANPESRCEFCTHLATYLSSEGIVPKETGLKYGMAKLVIENSSSGVRKLLAYVPFDSEEDRHATLIPEKGEKITITMRHGMVIGCEWEDDSEDKEGKVILRKILEYGT